MLVRLGLEKLNALFAKRQDHLDPFLPERKFFWRREKILNDLSLLSRRCNPTYSFVAVPVGLRPAG